MSCDHGLSIKIKFKTTNPIVDLMFNFQSLQVQVDAKRYQSKDDFDNEMKKIKKRSCVRIQGFPGKSPRGILSIFSLKV